MPKIIEGAIEEMKKQVNSRLVAFAQEAKARGMTYGELQAMETLAQIKAEKEKEEKAKKRRAKQCKK